MSQTYNIGCHDCAVSLWIGQCPVGSDLTRAYLYTAKPNNKFLRDFMFAHIGHRLEFNISDHFSYREIDTDPDSDTYEYREIDVSA